MIPLIKNTLTSIADLLSIHRRPDPVEFSKTERVCRVAAFSLASFCFFRYQCEMEEKKLLGITVCFTTLAIANECVRAKKPILNDSSTHLTKTPARCRFSKSDALAFGSDIGGRLPLIVMTYYRNPKQFSTNPLLILTTCIYIPLAEEYLFRGLVQESVECALVLATEKALDKTVIEPPTDSGPSFSLLPQKKPQTSVSMSSLETTAALIQSCASGLFYPSLSRFDRVSHSLSAYFRTQANKLERAISPSCISLIRGLLTEKIIHGIGYAIATSLLKNQSFP